MGNIFLKLWRDNYPFEVKGLIDEDDPLIDFMSNPDWEDPYTEAEMKQIVEVLIKSLQNTDKITERASMGWLQRWAKSTIIKMTFYERLIPWLMATIIFTMLPMTPSVGTSGASAGGASAGGASAGGASAGGAQTHASVPTPKPPDIFDYGGHNETIRNTKVIFAVLTLIGYSVKAFIWLVTTAECCLKRPVGRLRVATFEFDGKIRRAFGGGHANAVKTPAAYWKKTFFRLVRTLRDREKPLAKRNPLIEETANTWDPYALIERTWEWTQQMTSVRRKAVTIFRITEILTFALSFWMLFLGLTTPWCLMPSLEKNPKGPLCLPVDPPSIIYACLKILAAGELFFLLSFEYERAYEVNSYDLEVAYDGDTNQFGIHRVKPYPACKCADLPVKVSFQMILVPTYSKMAKITYAEFSKAMEAKLRSSGLLKMDSTFESIDKFDVKEEINHETGQWKENKINEPLL